MTKRARAAWWDRLPELLGLIPAPACRACGSPDIVWHHPKNVVKRFKVSRGVRDGYSSDAIMTEVAKCVPLCQSCHASHHMRIKHKWPGYEWSALYEVAENISPARG
jgi:hypothetical protein